MNNFIINTNGQIHHNLNKITNNDFYVNILCYQRVQQPDQVLKKLIANKNSYCILKTKNILSAFQLQLAIFQSITNLKNNKLKTKSLEAEIIYSLAPHTKISKAFQEFGIDTKLKSEQGQDLYVIHLTDLSDQQTALTNEELRADLDSLMNGEYYDIHTKSFDEITQELMDIESIAKVYGFDSKQNSQFDYINQLVSMQLSTKAI